MKVEVMRDETTAVVGLKLIPESNQESADTTSWFENVTLTGQETDYRQHQFPPVILTIVRSRKSQEAV